jgi:hypothetical protein
MTVVAFSLFSCKSNASSTSQTTTSTSNSFTPVSFTCSDKTYEKSYGTYPDNTEAHDYSNIKVKKTDKDW